MNGVLKVNPTGLTLVGRNTLRVEVGYEDGVKETSLVRDDDLLERLAMSGPPSVILTSRDYAVFADCVAILGAGILCALSRAFFRRKKEGTSPMIILAGPACGLLRAGSNDHVRFRQFQKKVHPPLTRRERLRRVFP